MKYKIPVSWIMFANIEIEANSLEKAIEKVEQGETPLPKTGRYVEDSFGIDFVLLDEEYYENTDKNIVNDYIGEV